MSVVVGISAEDEAEHYRVGSTQKWFHEALLVAESEDQLLPGTDCLQLSQLLSASQWGVTLMWQKGLISTDTLQRQAIIKHCLDLMPFRHCNFICHLQHSSVHPNLVIHTKSRAIFRIC